MKEKVTLKVNNEALLAMSNLPFIACILHLEQKVSIVKV